MIKDAANDLFRPLITQRKMNSKFCYLSGEDGKPWLIYLKVVGCISVTANVAQEVCSDMHLSWREGNIIKTQEINLKLSRLHNALFLESSPGQ